MANHDVEALEALTSTLTDSINGYEEAAEVASDPGISAFLRQKAQERRGVTSEFRTRIASLGGNSDVSGSASAALHRRFLDLRSMFQNDTKAAVAEVERGEGYLKERFETFMADEKLSAQTRDLIRSTYERVRFDHARWDQLKRAMQLTIRRSSRREYGYRPDHAWSDMADTTTVLALAIGAGVGLLAGALIGGSGQPSRTSRKAKSGRRSSSRSARKGTVLIREIMTGDVQLLSPQDSIQDAAQRMRDGDFGSLPVAQGDRLVGYVTDRDIVVRALADGRASDARVEDVMTDRILYCFDDENVDDVAANMAENQVRRLPVLNREKRLVGIVALGDIATKASDKPAEDALEGVSRPR
jgi:uncharacterized protein (TIGR02284 family)